MTENDNINCLVFSNGRYRMFTVKKSYTIRPLVVHLRRYNPEFQIVAWCYGELDNSITISNDKWYAVSEQEAAECVEKMYPIRIQLTEDKENLLQKYDYRTSLNLYYLHCADSNIYPPKNPFQGVKNGQNIPMELADKIGCLAHQKFIRNEDNPLQIKGNILKFYDGKYYERMYHGEKACGYLITNNRNNRNNQ